MIPLCYRFRPQPSLRRPRGSRQHLAALPATVLAKTQSEGKSLWDEIREKLFKSYALKSIDAVRRKLEQAILYIERNPETVKSIFQCGGNLRDASAPTSRAG
jgi:hypothetical protein